MSTKRCHIALYIGALTLGGAAKDTVTFAKEFSDLGHSVDLLLSQKKGVFLPTVPEEVRIFELGGSRALKDLLPLKTYLRKEKPDVLISALGQNNMIALLARRIARTHTKVIIREVVVSSMLKHQVRWGKSIRRWIAKKTYPWAENIVAVSEGVAHDLSQYLNLRGNQIEVIYGPVVTKDLLEKALEPVDHPWFKARSVPIVLAAGQLEPHKDFATLIRAFSLVRKNRLVRLIILGEGTHRPKLEQLAIELGIADDVSMPGFTLNPFNYMSRASVFVLTSPSEGLGNVIVEAMACGTPVVSTDCPGGPREILDGGRYGMLAPVGNTEAIAASILRTLDNPLPKEILREGALRFCSKKVSELYLPFFTSGDSTSSAIPV